MERLLASKANDIDKLYSDMSNRQVRDRKRQIISEKLNNAVMQCEQERKAHVEGESCRRLMRLEGERDGTANS